MKIVTASELRANLAAALDAVEDDAEALIVTRNGHEPLVVIPLREYESCRETAYLLRGANGRELRRRLAELESGATAVRDPLDSETDAA